MDQAAETELACDKELDALFKIYSRAAAKIKTTQSLKSDAKSSQPNAREINELPDPQRFVRKQKKINSSKDQMDKVTAPLPACKDDSTLPLPIKDSYNALLATLMDIDG